MKGIPKELINEVKHLRKTGVPRCMKCKKDFIRIDEESSEYHDTWKPGCKCIKKELRVSRG